MRPTDSAPPSSPHARVAWDDPSAALHETTNALTVILGWLDRARQAGAGSDERAAALERAARTALAARRALRLAIGAQAPEEPRECVEELVARTAEDLQTEASRAAVALTCATAPACARWAVAHPHTVWQILTNLLLNAIAATPTGGRVKLVAEPSAPDRPLVRFAVSDEGPGIREEHRDAIFQPGVTGRAEGAGLGLWYARAQADRHGGRLDLADSTGGARFELDWPCAGPFVANALAPERSPSPERDPSAQRPPSSTAPPDPCPPPPEPGRDGSGAQDRLRGRGVLILEDDRAVAELLDLALSARGATVTCIESPTELASALGRADVDTLLMDLSPLEGAVDDWMARARALRPDVAVIVISGSPGDPARAHAWVRKPFQPSELVAAIVRAHRR